MAAAKTTSTTTASKPVQKTTSTPRSYTSNTAAPRGNQVFLFDKTSYMWMLGGLALILIGIALTAGGKSADPNQFNYDEIYSFRRITLAPIMIMIGFAVEVYAIMRKPTTVEASYSE